MARDVGLQPRPVPTRAAPAAKPARGCGAGDHHEGCGHSARPPAGPAPIRVSQPGDVGERAADEAAQRVAAGQPAFDTRVSGPRPAGGRVAAALRPAGPGRPLGAGERTASEAAFGTDLSAVRVHDDDRADALSTRLGADAFTVGSDMYFRRGVYGSARPEHRDIVNHELAHVTAGAGAGDTIARHASWEHKMLGDVDPADLELIAAGRDLVAEKKSAKKEKRPEKTITNKDGMVISADMVLHTLEQEIERLYIFAKVPPTIATKAEQERRNDADEDRQLRDLRAAAGPDADDADLQANVKRWDVRLVPIRLKDGSKAIVTYGEINTLGDFYGSPKEIAETDPQQFRNYIYGIREESIRKFMRLHNEISKGLGRNELYNADSDRHKIEDDTATSMGNTGRATAESTGAMGGIASGAMGKVVGGAVSADAFSELKLMGEVPGAGGEKKYEVPGKPATGYTAGLARNACHFAPQSWHAWGTGHEKAVAMAQQSYDIKRRATDFYNLFQQFNRQPSPDEAKLIKSRLQAALDLRDRALLENGFADHFLQDSFAAGHLINKTLIMQWFVQWLDEHKMKRDYTDSDKWRQVQSMAYGQEGLAARDLYDAPVGSTKATDAQTTENMRDDRGSTWQKRFTHLGLQLPPSLKTGSDELTLFMWWQDQAGQAKLETSDVDELQKKGPIKDRDRLKAALYALINDGIIYYKNFAVADRGRGGEDIGLKSGVRGAKSLQIKKEYIPKDMTTFRAAVQDVQQGDTGDYADKLGSAVYSDYHTFLNHGYLQLSTNVLHDYFCKNGLWVDTVAGTPGYKIYGDNAMLQKESSLVVEWSARTSHMSRDSIYDISSTGTTANTTQAIDNRIPRYVTAAKGGATVSLEEWHEEDKGKGLKKLCWKTVFPEVAALFSKSTAVASDSLAPVVSGDVESGEPF